MDRGQIFTHLLHGISGERNKLEDRMTTRWEDNRLGCVLKYLKNYLTDGMTS